MSGNVSAPSQLDRRTARTRAAIVQAYNQLIQHRRQHSIRVSDIVAEANVGRSTFYEHFSGADAVFRESVARPLSILADAAAGAGDPERLQDLLRHFWDFRQRAREMLAGRQADRIGRILADLVEQRLAGEFRIPRRLIALQLAEAAFAPIRGWLAAEASCAPEQLGSAILAATAAAREALRT